MKDFQLQIVASGIIIPALTEAFNVSQKFKENTDVKYLLSTGFEDVPEFNSIQEVCVDKAVFTKHLTDTDIMEAIGVSRDSGLITREQALYQVSWLTSQQPKGEEGFLPTFHNSIIIGYVMNAGEIQRARLYWKDHNQHWYLRLGSLSGTIDMGTEVLVGSGILKS